MISKEWMKLQLTRRTKIEINMILLILLLNSFVDALPFKQDFPNNQNLSMIANIILSVWVWTFTTIGQLVSRRLILERCFIESQSQHYIDLSTIAKISTFIMDEDVRGYYVHCRSPYEYADCCYEELREYMEKESRGLYTQRGMDDPASPRDCQAFIFYATSIFRRQVNKALKSSKPNTARYELSSFLKSFIEQTPPPLHEGLRRKIRIATLGEKMMGFSTSGVRAGESGCVFYPDERTWISNYSFLKTTFQGLERDLFLQDVLTYCFILTIQSEVRTAVFFTYLMHLIRQFTCHHLGRRNVSKKAFVDKSFL
jgi:meckelin